MQKHICKECALCYNAAPAMVTYALHARLAFIAQPVRLA